MASSYIERRYIEFYEKHGYFPRYFEAYNAREITRFSPTLCTTGNEGGAGMVLIIETQNESQE